MHINQDSCKMSPLGYRRMQTRRVATILWVVDIQNARYFEVMSLSQNEPFRFSLFVIAGNSEPHITKVGENGVPYPLRQGRP